eukprot:700980-Prymnesium_polylepis.1
MMKDTMGGSKYEHSLHQPYPNGSPAPKFGMYIRFPSGTGGYTTSGITHGHRLVAVEIYALGRQQTAHHRLYECQFVPEVGNQTMLLPKNKYLRGKQ